MYDNKVETTVINLHCEFIKGIPYKFDDVLGWQRRAWVKNTREKNKGETKNPSAAPPNQERKTIGM